MKGFRFGALCLFFASVASAGASETGTPEPLTASSLHDGSYSASFAADGDPKTRWASANFRNTPEWLQVDFGQAVRLTGVTIHWETASAGKYELQVSDDAQVWRTVRRCEDGKGGRDVVEGFDVSARYLRVNCLAPGTQHPLFSIWELEFPGSDAEDILKQRIVAARERSEREKRERFADVFEKAGIEEVVFAARENGVDGHWYANFGYYAEDVGRKCYRAEGRLAVWKVKTGEIRLLIDDPQGTVRDPAVHYDATKIVFSWRRGGTEQFHLYEIGVDGSGLRQLTDGGYDDIEPAYLPDGGIVFVSGRCRRWVNCWLTQVGTIHRCDAEGKNIRPLSANIEHDNTPWVLPDGRIAYQRWEYVDRSQVDYHHLWTMNPDGTNQMILFGNMHPGNVFIDAKPVPGTEEVVLIASPGHGQNEHAGHVALLSTVLGPDNLSALKHVTKEAHYRDPYPLTRDVFMAARDRRIVLLQRDGTERELFALPASFGQAQLHEPRPIVARPREHAVPHRVDLTKDSGTLIVADVYVGRNMEGVRRGDIRTLLVVESLPKPINFTGGMDPMSYGGTFTLERVLGTVPVEEDGSAHLELPANRAFFFIAMDEKNLSVKCMQSFLTLMPGEVQSCVGCHEQRTQTMTLRPSLQAMRRAPSKVEPLASLPEVFDFPRDIQPILDRHCVRCHGYDAPSDRGGKGRGPYAGKVILTGDRGPMFSHSYFHLTLERQFVDGRNQARSNLPPRSIGSSASPLMKKIAGEHHGVKVSAREADTIRYWIEAGAAYPGTYAALGTGMIGGYAENQQVETGADWPEARAAAQVVERRCKSCHAGERLLPRNLSDEIGISFWRMELNDRRLRQSRHRVFNLTRPEKSLMLLAPLARSAGGWGICASKDAPPVFADAGDADYRTLLALCERGRQRLEEIKRFDMPGFRPRSEYIREMKRYGVLPTDLAPDAPVDPYRTDRAYWESLWYRP